MDIDLAGQVAIVTGAGAGLGRQHALALAERGARVVVNDIGPGQAEAVAAEIAAAGGQAIADSTDVSDFGAVTRMVETIEAQWGGIDILVNNAGILRDRTFAKMDIADFRAVIEVNLMGTVHCTKAVWDGMRERGHGRIVMTTSSSGLFGQFGQANYSAAKMALVGLMKTLAMEGARHGIRVNCLAPSAATAMTGPLYTDEALSGLGPVLVSPAVVALASRDAPTGQIMLAGAGSFKASHVTMTRGVWLGGGPGTAEVLLDRWEAASAPGDSFTPESGDQQYRYEVEQAMQQGRDPASRIAPSL